MKNGKLHVALIGCGMIGESHAEAIIYDGRAEISVVVYGKNKEAAEKFAEKYNIPVEKFTSSDIHIHVPDGATPKDGPSAGITMTLALTSLLTGKPLVKKLAMTGEVTLAGRVTAIGGLREKLVGALTAGIENILIPEENVKDLEEIPGYIKDKLSIAPVSTVDEALKYGFGTKKFPAAGK